MGILSTMQRILSLLEFPIALGVGGMLIYLLGETITMDWRLSFVYFGGRQAFSDKITIVEIDEETLYRNFIQKRKSYSPLDRGFLDSLIKAIEEYQPKVIGLDILLEAPSDNPPIDTLLAQTLAKHSNIIIGSSLFTTKKGQTLEFGPLPLFATNRTLVGFANIMGAAPLKGTTKMRRYRLIEEASGEVVSSFAYSLFLQYLYARRNPGQWLNQDECRRMLTEKSAFLCGSMQVSLYKFQRTDDYFVNYSGSSPVTVSAHRVYNRDANPLDLKDRIVLVGGSSERLQDNFDTAVGRIPGVMIHGYIVSNLLEDFVLRYPSFRLQFIISFIFLILALIIMKWKGLRRGLVYTWAILGIYWIIVFILFLKYPTLWIPLNGPSSMIICLTFFFFVWNSLETDAKSHIKSFFEKKFVIPKLIKTRKKITTDFNSNKQI